MQSCHGSGTALVVASEAAQASHPADERSTTWRLGVWQPDDFESDAICGCGLGGPLPRPLRFWSVAEATMRMVACSGRCRTAKRSRCRSGKRREQAWKNSEPVVRHSTLSPRDRGFTGRQPWVAPAWPCSPRARQRGTAVVRSRRVGRQDAVARAGGDTSCISPSMPPARCCLPIDGVVAFDRSKRKHLHPT